MNTCQRLRSTWSTASTNRSKRPQNWQQKTHNDTSSPLTGGGFPGTSCRACGFGKIGWFSRTHLSLPTKPITRERGQGNKPSNSLRNQNTNQTPNRKTQL